MIVISWFTSPLLAGIVGAILWLFTRHAGEWTGVFTLPHFSFALRGDCQAGSHSPPLCLSSSPLPSCAVLRRQNSFKLSLLCLPLFTFLTVYIGTYYIIQKGPKLADKVSDATNAWISACFGELDLPSSMFTMPESFFSSIEA